MSTPAFRFSCTGCGRCCTGRGDYYVAVSLEEQRRIQRHLDVSRAWFRRRYVTVHEDGTESLRWAGDRCVFLGSDGRCRIYAARPAQCRDYPFWPEVVRSTAGWQRERRRCEGIGRGPAIPLAEVRRRLAAQRPHPDRRERGPAGPESASKALSSKEKHSRRGPALTAGQKRR